MYFYCGNYYCTFHGSIVQVKYTGLCSNYFANSYINLFNDRYGERRRGSISAIEMSGIDLLAATFKQLRKPNQQLLIPLTTFIGMEQALIGADFTQV